MSTFEMLNTLDATQWLQLGFAAVSLLGATAVSYRPRFRGLILLLILNACYMLLATFGSSVNEALLLPVFTLAIGPAIYLFVRHLVYAEHRHHAMDGLHFLPLTLAIPMVESPQTIILLGLTMKVVYTLMSLRLVRRYHRASFTLRSDAESTRLSWVYWVLMVFVSISGVEVLRFLFAAQISSEATLVWHQVYLLTAISLCASLMYKSFRSQPLFDGLSQFEQWLKQHEKALERGFTRQAKIDFRQVEILMQTEHCYRDPDLTVHELAKRLELDAVAVVRAVTQGAGCNFCDYINGQRIAELKKALQHSHKDADDLHRLGEQFGLSADLDINSLFRRFSGFTPRQVMQHPSR